MNNILIYIYIYIFFFSEKKLSNLVLDSFINKKEYNYFLKNNYIKIKKYNYIFLFFLFKLLKLNFLKLNKTNKYFKKFNFNNIYNFSIKYKDNKLLIYIESYKKNLLIHKFLYNYFYLNKNNYIFLYKNFVFKIEIILFLIYRDHIE